MRHTFRSDTLCVPLVVALAVVARAGTTERVSVSTAGAQGDLPSARFSQPTVSADGFIVAFDSDATTLVAGDTNVASDVFVRDRVTGTTERVSVNNAGTQGSAGSSGSVLSADGRFVAFSSGSTNFVTGDTNGAGDVFVFDRVARTIARESVDSAGAQGNGGSLGATLSADGRYVAFISDASNLVANDTNGTRDVFVRDRFTGTTERASLSTAGAQGNAFSVTPALSAGGRFVAFGSFASNLVMTDANSTLDVFVRDRQTNVTTRASVDGTGTEGNGLSAGAGISADGRWVSFFSDATNLVAGDNNATRDVFVHDTATGATERVNVGSSGVEADFQSSFSARGGASVPAISADGRYVAFDSFATNLVPGDVNGSIDVFVRDRIAGTTERVSVNTGDVAGDDSSSDPGMTPDGLTVVFLSLASNLVAGDTNFCGAFSRMGQCPDVFARFRTGCVAGTVNSGVGATTNVLGVNGGTGLVSVALGAPIDISLALAPAGPSAPRYVVWVWPGVPANPRTFRVTGQPIGCLANPSPLESGLAPQAIRCIRGGGVPRGACGATPEFVRSPRTGPWTLHSQAGLASPATFTLQGILEDAGAATSLGFSVTNAVILSAR